MAKIGFLMRGEVIWHKEKGQFFGLHRLGQLAVAGQPDAPGCARVYFGLLQGGIFPKKSGKATGYYLPGGVS